MARRHSSNSGGAGWRCFRTRDLLGVGGCVHRATAVASSGRVWENYGLATRTSPVPGGADCRQLTWSKASWSTSRMSCDGSTSTTGSVRPWPESVSWLHLAGRRFSAYKRATLVSGPGLGADRGHGRVSPRRSARRSGSQRVPAADQRAPSEPAGARSAADVDEYRCGRRPPQRGPVVVPTPKLPVVNSAEPPDIGRGQGHRGLPNVRRYRAPHPCRAGAAPAPPGGLPARVRSGGRRERVRAFSGAAPVPYAVPHNGSPVPNG